MRRLLLLIVALVASLPSFAQPGLTTFETPALPTADTYYVNYSAPGTDVGFDQFQTHFPCVYDTGFGAKFWSSGFIYSNMHDSVTSGFRNQYATKAKFGVNGSQQYLVGYGQTNIIRPVSSSWLMRVGYFYITNSTYAYNSMRDGDAFAKKFGGGSGNDPDWFKLTVRGYKHGILTNDSVEFYLADFRFTNNSQDYIVKDWSLVVLAGSLDRSDSLKFSLSSSDTGMFGMNTPAYFCIDNWSVFTEGLESIPFANLAVLSPNPTSNFLRVELKDMSVKTISVMDMAGRTIATIPVASERNELNTSALPAGQYLLKLEGAKGISTTRFIKQ
jgi:hypothetical protein